MLNYHNISHSILRNLKINEDKTFIFGDEYNNEIELLVTRKHAYIGVKLIYKGTTVNMVGTVGAYNKVSIDKVFNKLLIAIGRIVFVNTTFCNDSDTNCFKHATNHTSSSYTFILVNKYNGEYKIYKRG